MVGRNMSLKNPVTQPGIDARTVRLVTQRLNHYTTPGPVKNRRVQQEIAVVFLNEVPGAHCVSVVGGV